MLRVVLWRSYFELLNLLKIFGWRGRPVQYFAFGANLDPAVLELRKITVRSGRPFALNGYKLVFDHQGPFEGGGFASVVDSPGSVAYGKLYEMPYIDELRMDCYEAMPFLRRHRKIRFHSPVGEIYFYQSRSPRPGLVPTRTYFQKILTCYESTPDFPVEFLAEFRETAVLPDEKPVKNLNFVILQPHRYGRVLQPWLERYDRFCFGFFLKLIYRPSLFDKYIPR